MTPLPGPWASIAETVAIPLEEHKYEEYRDSDSGFWTCVCYTCNRYFVVHQDFNKNHEDHYRSYQRKAEIERKRLAAGKVDGSITLE